MRCPTGSSASCFRIADGHASTRRPDSPGRGTLSPIDPLEHLWSLVEDHRTADVSDLRRAVDALLEASRQLAKDPTPAGTTPLATTSFHHVYDAPGTFDVPSDGGYPCRRARIWWEGTAVSDAREVRLPVVRVTAYEDRADVVREATVDLVGGTETLVLRGLSPLVSQDHVVATVQETTVQETTAQETTAQETTAQETTAQETTAQETTAQESTAQETTAQIDDVRVEHLWIEDERHDSARLEELEEEIRIVKDKADAAIGDVVRLLSQCKKLDTLASRFAAQVGHGLARGLKANGEAVHEAGQLEDLHALTLSTARPSAGATLPTVGPDLPQLRQQTRQEKRTIQVEHRQEEVPRADLSGAAPGVYDGGEVREMCPAGRVSIRSDGRPHRVAVGAFVSAARVERVAFPELSPQVFHRATLVNEAGTPLLAGPVTLLSRGSWVGVRLRAGKLETVKLGFHFETSGDVAVPDPW